MSIKDLIKKRYSTRKFKDIVVEKEKIEEILDIVRFAPSAVNRQPWHFVVITETELLERVMGTYKRDWIRKAPVIIAACGNYDESWKRKNDGKDHCDMDIAIAVDHLTLAALELGLGTCWVCNYDAEECDKILELPEGLKSIALIPIGYPEDLPEEMNNKEKPRKTLDEIVTWR